MTSPGAAGWRRIAASWKEKRRLGGLRLGRQKVDGGARDHTDLRAAFGIRETNRSFLRVKPFALQAECFQPSEAGEQQQADRRKCG